MSALANLDELEIGYSLPPFEKTFTSVDFFAYGAATWDWARLHYDAAYAREFGFPDVFADGQHHGAILSQFLLGWLGPRAFVSRMKLNYRTLVFPGDTVVGKGNVVDLLRGDTTITLAVEQAITKRNASSDLVCTCASVLRVTV